MAEGSQNDGEIVRSRPKDRYIRRVQVPQEIIKDQKKLIESQSAVIEILDRLAIRDSLTGLHNRGFLDKEIEKLKPTDKFAAVMLDADEFKKFNDTYGHKTGDKVLKSLSRVLVDNIQIVEGENPDVIARYGGEEFAILFKNFNDREAVKRRLEYIRKEIEGQRIDRDNKDIKFTASFGVAFSDGVSSADEVLKKADEALYVSKQNGRNQVTVAE